MCMNDKELKQKLFELWAIHKFRIAYHIHYALMTVDDKDMFEPMWKEIEEQLNSPTYIRTNAILLRKPILF